MKLQIRRHAVQFCAAVLYNANAFTPLTGRAVDFPYDKTCVPGLNCQYCRNTIAGCPLGVTQQALSGSFSAVAWQFWGLLVLFGLLFGRMICGWACPMGWLQELLNKVPFPKLKKNRMTYYLSYVKYVMTALFVLAVPLYTGLVTGRGITTFCAWICPGNFLEALFLPTLFQGSVDNLIIAVQNSKFFWVMALLVAMLWIYRPFCRFLCPLGAFYGLFNRFSAVGMTVDVKVCIHCSACVQKCPMDIRSVGDRECIGCGACISSCPTKAIRIRRPFGK